MLNGTSHAHDEESPVGMKAGERLRFQPEIAAGQPFDEQGRTYFLQVPSFADRLRFARELAIEAGHIPTVEERRTALFQAVLTYETDDATRTSDLAFLEDFFAKSPGPLVDVTAIEDAEARAKAEAENAARRARSRRFSELYARAMENDIEYRRVIAQGDYAETIAKLLRIKMFVVDWAPGAMTDAVALPAKCTRQRGMLTEEALNAIPVEDLGPLWQRIALLMQVPEAQKKS